ncbi:MAG: winged helix DNA-binding protein [Flavobacteriales bacterium]|jgi:DNA-binding MarR family transcriptional regulator|nr:winged helix DNA-binding protein [Flavobacteriales bacterium]
MELFKELKMSKDFTDINEKTIVNIFYTAKVLEKRTLLILKPYQINNQHYNVLRILRGRYPKSATPSDIREVLIDKTSDLTRLLDKMVNLEIVERENNLENRRKVDLTITQKGLDLLDKIQQPLDELHGLESNVCSKALGHLNEALDAIRANI